MMGYQNYSDWPESGFPGIAVNPATLLSEVVDAQACAEALQAGTDVADQVFVLLTRGDYKVAAERITQARLSDPGSLRLRILEADLASLVQEHERAIRRMRNLVTENQGTAQEALLRQHLGKAYFTAGQFQSAANNFAQALELRVAAGAEPALIYSSTVALQRAREMVERTDSVA